MKNRELFQSDPLSFTIPNDGVTTIANPSTPPEWDVLKYELRSFVCEGEYYKGLERILSTFLANLDQPKQPAVWVSGFYGSGKSHLVRVLEYLWRDVEFPDEVKARSHANLPADIRDLLKELSTAGKRHGGLWSAAGTLSASAGSSVRLAMLAIVFRSAGLPGDYAQARFVIWLKQKGYFEKVNKYVEKQKFSLAKELKDMYVSPLIADGLLSAYPDFANNAMDAHVLINAQFAQKEDISNDELIAVLHDVFELQQEASGRLPLTLIVLDELQQFIGENQQRALDVQEVVQACSSRFGSRLLFVGTGQASLQGNPQLSRLKDRFTVQTMLEDSDVERVVRQVVLSKNQSAEPNLKGLLEKVRGEIDRHLVGTRISPTNEDNSVLISDYPLLPTRRRFWERVLRAIDPGGTQGQLRTQLRVVHESNRMVADLPVGNVVPADVIYDQQSSSMLQTATLSRELDLVIQQMDDGTEDGKLRSRLCKLIFLIGKLPTEGAAATGLRATADALADLMVQDLKAGSGKLRQEIPALLLGLVEKGTLLRIDDEYRLQTAESADWEADFRKRLAAIRADETRVPGERESELRKAVTLALKGISLTQGKSRTPRKFQLFFSVEAPKVENSDIPIWVQDEWSASEKAVKEAAQRAGVESPVVFVFLPKREADSLREAIINFHAATESLNTRPNPTTPGGFEARQGMDFRRASARGQLDRLVDATLEKARVYQGGGSEVHENGLAPAVKATLDASLIRLFPRFDMADHASWGTVITHAREGAADSLRAVGYQGDPDRHPVCQEILRFIGAGKKGSEVRKHFMGSGFGWSQDAVDGSLFALLTGDHLAVTQNHKPVAPKELDRTQINTSEFIAQVVTITTAQRIQLRGLLTDAEIKYTNGEENLAIPALLQKLLDLSLEAGGLPPLPAYPSKTRLDELGSLVGNEQFAAVVEAKGELKELHKAWKAAKARKDERMPRWGMLKQLQGHAASLPVVADAGTQIEAIQSNRTLLENPDPIKPLIDKLYDALRTTLQAAYKNYKESFNEEMSALTKTAVWKKLKEKQQQETLFQFGLSTQAAAPKVGTPEELLGSLNAASLEAWSHRTAALGKLFEDTRLHAARLLEPEAVRIKVPAATIKTTEELSAYLEKFRKEVQKHLDDDHPVIL